MDNYTVGSVADLISQFCSSKNKTKKSVLKEKPNTKSEANQVEDVNKKTKKSLSKEKPNKKSETKQREVESLNQESLTTKRNKSNLPKNEIELKPKKRKKKVVEGEVLPSFSDTLPKLKKPKGEVVKDEALPSFPDALPKFKKPKTDLIDFDHIPSDSADEEDDLTNTHENSETNVRKQSKDDSVKKSQFKDFKKNTVFIGNLPLNFDKQKVCKVFSKFGKIQSARIRCVPVADINMSKKVAAVKKKFNPKRNSLVAYVKYESEESVKAALEANGMVIESHHLRVDLAEENKERDNKKAVFVGGLPFNIEDDELWEFFQRCGKINSVRVIRDSQTSMGKGFGYVNFDSTASVELALQLNGEQLKKRAINVKRCTAGEKKKNKFGSFGKNKSKEMTDQLIGKKKQRKMLKAEKRDPELKKKPISNEFQGNKANVKHKKKKKLSKAALRTRKVMKILGSS